MRLDSQLSSFSYLGWLSGGYILWMASLSTSWLPQLCGVGTCIASLTRCNLLRAPSQAGNLQEAHGLGGLKHSATFASAAMS